jgi:hypothetical protein
MYAHLACQLHLWTLALFTALAVLLAVGWRR